MACSFVQLVAHLFTPIVPTVAGYRKNVERPKPGKVVLLNLAKHQGAKLLVACFVAQRRGPCLQVTTEDQPLQHCVHVAVSG